MLSTTVRSGSNLCQNSQMKTLLLTLVFLCLAGATSAQDFGKGMEAMKRGDFAAAVVEWRPLAEAGDSASQFNLGVLYERGLGVGQDHSQARRWYQSAADQRNAPAHVSLGRFYENGFGGAQDYVRALMSYETAVALGISEAVEYRDDLAAKLTPEQVDEAKRLMSESVTTAAGKEPTPQQNTIALATVRNIQGNLNTLGHDAGPADGIFGARTEAAIRAFERAAKLPVTGTVTDELVARLEQSARAKQGETGKPSTVASAPPKTITNQSECDIQAAHPGDDSRPPEVAGVPFEDINIALAVEACREALVQKPGDPRYQYQFARSLHKAQRYGEAVILYERSGGQGSVLAQKSVGFMYANGLGVAQNYAEAAKWHHKAAVQGDADAQHNLGFIYAKGRGVPLDNVQAHLWYSLAVEQGNEEAEKNRKLLAAKMSASQIADAEQRTREWLDQHRR